MIEILSVGNMRESDANTIRSGISGRELMMRAGRAIFENAEWKPPVAIVCGTGNNAGDGYVLAKLLHDAGIACTLILLEEKFSEDGKYYFDICREAGISVKIPGMSGESQNTEKDSEEISCAHISAAELSTYSTIVDCLFGTGFKGDVRGKAADIINAINTSGAYVISVDINSGLNGDSGMAESVVVRPEHEPYTGEDVKPEPTSHKISGTNNNAGCVISDLTISIGSFKPGHFLNMAKDMMKRKINCDIGITPVDRPFYLLEKTDLKPFFAPRFNYSNKGTYGYVALIGGSKRYSGAIRLAAMANAAMRAGAGVVKIAVPSSLCPVVASNILESTLFPLSDDDGEARFVESEIAELISNVKTVAFGMGIGITEETAKILDYLLDNYTGRLIIDADGLTLLPRTDPEKIRQTKAQLILTPHIKEFSRLLVSEKIESPQHSGNEVINEILSTPIEHARRYALDHKLILLLKGPSTIITDGNITYITDAGCAGMATAGSGDVLSGILAAVCAYLPEMACHAKLSGSSTPDLLKASENSSNDVSLETPMNNSTAFAGTPKTGLAFSVAVGAYINGKAGELAQERTNSISMIASDTVSCITDVISGLV
ncbi:MAG: NAD(P)H-hydrate dehydratase [Lachnospiraceae bacterium]|nr:NAD(P)H-hydrate dehydratase [Lachnospiraceae bacterium]